VGGEDSESYDDFTKYYNYRLIMAPPGEDFSGLKETSAFLAVVEVLTTVIGGILLLPLFGICASTQYLMPALGVFTLNSASMGINLLLVYSLKMRGVEGASRLEAFAWLGAALSCAPPHRSSCRSAAPPAGRR
jgi:hypothetical protein